MKFKVIPEHDGMSVQLWEMSRIGFMDEYEIYVHTDDPGNIPHFHIWDRTTRGKEFHTCIRIDKAEYFHHTGKEDILNSKDRKDLVKFLQSNPKNKRFNTNWEVVIDMWNFNNSDKEIDEDQPMPDYTQLRG